MSYLNGKLLVLAAVLMVLTVPAVAQNESGDEFDIPEEASETDGENNSSTGDRGTERAEDTDDLESSGVDGTDNSTGLKVSMAEAEKKARGVLSDLNWTLEDSGTHEEEGYYRFEFTAGESEAEVRVDGSSGKVFRHREDIEQENETGEIPEREKVQNLEEARERISEMRETIRELRAEIRQLKEENPGELPEEASDTAREVRENQDPPETPDRSETEFETQRNNTELEIEQDGNRTRVEVERNGTETEIEREGPSQNSRRPGFVSGILNSIFG